jgi:UDP-galactopyranose mutase
VGISKPDLIVVGAGLFGLTIAERTANVLGKTVQIVESRDHIGGNAFSYLDPNSKIEVHKYGSHIFHTSNKIVFEYVSQFMSLNHYEHRVLSSHKDVLYEFPINLNTLNKFFNLNLKESEADLFFESIRVKSSFKAKNLQEKAIELVGQDLYMAFIRGYTAKQWDEDPINLPSSIISRIPVRLNRDSRYFDDLHQGIPAEGYQSWFNAMLSNSKIHVELSNDFLKNRDQFSSDVPIVYTGAIDRFFNFKYGLLGWRTLDFKIENVNERSFQSTAVINYPDMDVPYTRIHEFKKLHPERYGAENLTTIMYEYSRNAERDDDPYYPMNRSADRENYIRYREEASNLRNVIFAGRLGSYKYLDMDMAIASALVTFQNKILPRFLHE